MLALESDHIRSEGEVITNANPRSNSELDAHGLVVRGTNAHCSAEVRSYRRSCNFPQIHDAEHCSALPVDAKLLGSDGDADVEQCMFNTPNQFDVRYRLERIRTLYRRQSNHFLTGNHRGFAVNECGICRTCGHCAVSRSLMCVQSFQSCVHCDLLV